MCAPHCPTPSPTPSAAPSVPQSPGTAPGAPIGRTAPAGRIYLTSAGNIAYTYADGGFWMYWFERTCPQWKPTALLAERYARENRGPEMRSPAQWLAEYAASHDFKEITQKEFDTMCETGIAPSGDAAATTGGTAACICSTCTCGGCKEECFGNCRSCGHPVQECNSYQTEGEKHLTPTLSEDIAEPEVPGTQTAQDKPLTFIRKDKCPAFDYSGLTDQTVENLHFAEDEYRHGKQMAERGLVHMGNAIAAAHDALCGVVQLLDNSKHGNRGDDSFRAWCCSIGITKSTAYNLLQVSALMDGSSPRQRAILEALPPTLLYAVAKPSAPAELVQAVKEGEITTHKEYQALLAQLKAERERADNAEERAQGAERQLEAAQADVAAVLERAQAAQRSAELDAKELQRLDKLATHYKAENDRRAADQQRLEGLNATLVQEMAEKTARIQELEARPVEVTGATEKEIARWKAEGAKAERDKAQKERDKAAVREAALRKELTDLREDNEQVGAEMLALQSELCELRRQTDQGQGDPADPTRYAAAACRAILLPELERIAQLPNGAYRDAMEVLYELSDALGYACANGGSWPQEATEPDTPMEDVPEDAEEDPGFEEWPGWMHQKWAEEHPEEGENE